MSEKYMFSVNGHEYSVDNSAYLNRSSDSVCFEVKECPKCHMVYPSKTNRCYQCKSDLSADSVCIASWHRRIGVGLWIGSGLWGVTVTALSMGAGIRLGGLPTLLVLGVCYYVGRIIAGRKIVIDRQATEDYRTYLALHDQKSISAAQDPDALKKYALVKVCKECGKRTEEDSVYCSNCGKKIKEIEEEVAPK